MESLWNTITSIEKGSIENLQPTFKLLFIQNENILCKNHSIDMNIGPKGKDLKYVFQKVEVVQTVQLSLFVTTNFISLTNRVLPLIGFSLKGTMWAKTRTQWLEGVEME